MLKWLSVVLSIGLGLHMDSDEFQTAVKWWLGMETSLVVPHVLSAQTVP